MKKKAFALFLVLCMMITVFAGCKTMDAISAAQDAIAAAESAGSSVTPEQVQQVVDSATSGETGTGTAQDIINAITDASSGSAPAPSTAPSTAPEPASLLRSDGLYCYINDWNNDGLTNNYCMRFYDDGTLIFCSMEQSNPNSNYFPQSDWFDKETDYKDLVSTYELDGDYIEFYTANPAGTVDYWGTVKEDRLVLDSHSNINGNETQGREYVFFPFSEIQGW